MERRVMLLSGALSIVHTQYDHKTKSQWEFLWILTSRFYTSSLRENIQ